MAALQTEKNSKQQEYDACLTGVNCSPARAAELGSELFRLKSTYEQTVRQGVAVGDLKWVLGDNLVPTDYFDGLVGLGAVGVGAALRVGGALGEVANGSKPLEVRTEVNRLLKLGQTGFIDGIENTKVGRWMSADEVALMQSKGVVQQGAGGLTFVSINGASDFRSAAPLKSVYVEFNVPSNSLLQAGKDGWLKIIGPNAMESKKFMLKKQGGILLPVFNDLKILESK